MKNLGFSDALVPLVLAGSKPVTRRGPSAMTRYKVGEIVFVGEALVAAPAGTVRYRRDQELVHDPREPLPGKLAGWTWKPRVLAAMYCPAWAARGWLRILDLRAERLGDIDDADALLEGVRQDGRKFFDPGDVSSEAYYVSARDCYLGMWRRLHGDKSLQSNPVVTRIAYEVVSAEEARKAAA